MHHSTDRPWTPPLRLVSTPPIPYTGLIAAGTMTSSSATPSVRTSGEALTLLAGRSPDWRRIGESVRGPLLTLATAVVLDVLRRHEVGILTPFPLLMLT